ncbi:MAG: hypothetical protein ACLP50_13015 [Solirubrobacteraceae bacterium]
MTTHTSHNRSGKLARLRRGGLGLGAAAALLLTAGVASAAPPQPAPTPSVSTLTLSIKHSAHATAGVRSASGAAASSASSVTVTPGTVRAGAHVRISGFVAGNARAHSITLMSDAFTSRDTVNGIPALQARVLPNGTFSMHTTIAAGRASNTYAIVARYGSHYLPQVAWVRVLGR